MPGLPITHSESPVVPASGPSRLAWMDVLRGTAVLLVLVFHSASLLRYADLPVPRSAELLDAAVAPFRIPLLVLLSGTLLPRSVAKGSRDYLVGKWRAIAWPYLLWTAVYAVLTWPGGAGPLTWYLPGLLRGGTYLWYLFFLLVFYVVALPLRRVPRLPAALGLLLVSELLPDGTKYLERPCYLMALFLVGWWIADDPARLRAVLSSHRVLAVAAVLLVPAVLWAPDGGYGPRSIVATLAGACLAAALAARCGGAQLLRPLRFVGRNSVVFYVVHFPVIYVVVHVAAALGEFPAPVVQPVALVAAVVAASALASARPRWRGVEWLFTAPGRPRSTR